MELLEGIRHVIDGNGIIFLGAGYSINAINIANSKMKVAGELSSELCKEIGMPNNRDLSKVSDIYLSENEPCKLIDKLILSYQCKETKEYHDVIANLPWKRIYTTNYDDVFERASVNSGIIRKTYTLKDNVRTVKKNGAILHINGFINNITNESLNNDFKLTSESYLVENFTKSDWSSLFKSDIKNNRVIFFVGCSFDYDLDLQRIIKESPDVREKIIFIDKVLSDEEKSDKYINYYKNKFGSVENIGVDKFGDIINNIKKTYTANTQAIKFKCFNHIGSVEYKYSKVTTQDIWNLISYGTTKEDLLYHNHQNNNYVLNRKVASRICKLISGDSKAKLILIHSDLGNGKSSIIDNIKYRLNDFGNVFVFNKEFDFVDDEIAKIDELNGRKIIIIENYYYYLNIIEKFRPYINSDYKFIFTARSYVNESVSFRLKDILRIDDDNIFPFDVNVIENGDVENIIKLLDKVEVWKEFKDIPYSKKKKKIVEDYNSNIREIILDLVNSENVSKKILQIYSKVEETEEKKTLLLATLINSVIGLEMGLQEIVDYIELPPISNDIKNDENFNELVDMRNYKIKCKSSILAKFIIRNRNIQHDLIKIIRTMNYNANNDLFDNSSLKVRKALISISNIWEVLDIKNKMENNIKDEILQYYDSVKDFKDYHNNPYFWLQYAIACLDMKEYNRAKNYFEIAYREGKKRNSYNTLYEFDTFQIDTQYARYLLENYIYKEETKDPMRVMDEAHGLLIKALNSNRSQKHYIFRQVTFYHKFFKKYKDELDSNKKNKFIIYCREMIERIEKYSLGDHEKTNGVIDDSKTNSLKKCIVEIYNTATN